VFFELKTAPVARWVPWPLKQLECQFQTARGRTRVPRRLLSPRQAAHGCSASAPCCQPEPGGEAGANAQQGV